MGVLATLRHHKEFVDALKDEPFVDELKKSLDKFIFLFDFAWKECKSNEEKLPVTSDAKDSICILILDGLINPLAELSNLCIHSIKTIL